MQTSESLDTLQRFAELALRVRDAHREILAVAHRLADWLDTGSLKWTRALEQARAASQRLKQAVQVSRSEVDRLANELDGRRRTEIERRRDSLKAARSHLARRQSIYAKLERRTAVDEHAQSLLQRAVGERRAEMVITLDRIFPIRPEADSLLSFTIIDARPTDGSGLGHVALLVALLASYHHIALQQALAFRGSRSLVQDRGVWYPLYEDGVERYRHEYARFLLNKDIEQLCHSRGLEVPDLRQSLANLYNFTLASSTVADSSDDETTSSDSPPRPPSVRSVHSASSARTITAAGEKLRALRL